MTMYLNDMWLLCIMRRTNKSFKSLTNQSDIMILLIDIMFAVIAKMI
jgi:hypothetical protein